mmetsp:Transcript_85605/g.135802  ORF Transcript_85605/g.135802 Transcript_85605/m.135802 type:complete len:187 (+) Transcript_85605:138-698(+)
MSRSILGCLMAASCLVALEITQGLEEDPGCADGDLRLLQVKLSLQRSETAGDGTWKASVVAAAAQTAGGVSTSLPQLQMRYQKVSPADLAWAAKEQAMKQDALREIVAADVEISNGLGSMGGHPGIARPEHHAERIRCDALQHLLGFEPEHHGSHYSLAQGHLSASFVRQRWHGSCPPSCRESTGR